MAANNTPKLPRSEQSRINGAKSKGPTSAEGKARSSANSMKHGFAAAINNVIVVEDKEAFDRHVAGYRAALMPQNYLEETLVDQLASINWRQTRLVGLETALLDAQLSFQKDVFLETQPEGAHDPYFRLVFAWEALSRKSRNPEDDAALPETFDVHCLELVRRYITTLDRQYRNTLLNLRQYRRISPSRNPPNLLPDQTNPRISLSPRRPRLKNPPPTRRKLREEARIQSHGTSSSQSPPPNQRRYPLRTPSAARNLIQIERGKPPRSVWFVGPPTPGNTSSTKVAIAIEARPRRLNILAMDLVLLPRNRTVPAKHSNPP